MTTQAERAERRKEKRMAISKAVADLLARTETGKQSGEILLSVTVRVGGVRDHSLRFVEEISVCGPVNRGDGG